MNTSKTYKREVAGGMLLFLAGLFVWSIIDPGSPAKDVAEYLTWPIFSFAGGAWALDVMIKKGGR
jgi:hypothetical protein